MLLQLPDWRPDVLSPEEYQEFFRTSKAYGYFCDDFEKQIPFFTSAFATLNTVAVMFGADIAEEDEMP